MPGQRGSESRQKTKTLTTRWTVDEYAYLTQVADLTGCTKAEILRRLVAHAYGSVLPTKALVREIHRIGVNLNQVAKVANATGGIDELLLNTMQRELSAALRILKP